MPPKKIKASKRENRDCLVQSRLTHKEQREFHVKAELYAKGEMSEFIRMAGLAYRPVKRVEK